MSISQECIEAIEDSPFSPQGKFQLVSVLLGLRDACQLAVHTLPWREDSTPKLIDPDLAMHIYDVLRLTELAYGRDEASGVTFMKQPAVPAAMTGHRSRMQRTMLVPVARTNFLLGDWRRAMTQSNREKLWRLYGHPPSSIHASIREITMPLSTLTPSEVMTDAVRFLDFPLSRTYWRQELQQMSKRVQAVREVSEVVYQQVRMTNFCKLSDEQVQQVFGRSRATPARSRVH